MYKLIAENLLPGSGLNAVENFKAFYDEVQNGKSGLILMEHYTNMDLPEIVYMLEKYGEDWSTDFAKKIVAIAGMKLNEADPAVRASAEGFSRVVIYPTRSLDAVAAKDISDEEKEKYIADKTYKYVKQNLQMADSILSELYGIRASLMLKEVIYIMVSLRPW